MMVLSGQIFSWFWSSFNSPFWSHPSIWNLHLCFTLSISADARQLVFSSERGRLHVGHVSRDSRHVLQMMWPTGHEGIGPSLGTNWHTGHSRCEARSSSKFMITSSSSLLQLNSRKKIIHTPCVVTSVWLSAPGSARFILAPKAGISVMTPAPGSDAGELISHLLLFHPRYTILHFKHTHHLLTRKTR